MADVATYLTYAKVSQQEFAFRDAKNLVFKGSDLVPRYVRLLYIVRNAVQYKYDNDPTNSTLDATANYMFSLSKKRTVPTPQTSPFIIIVQPVSQTKIQGDNASFSVVVSGGTQPYFYQWYFNNTILPGETASTLSLTSVDSGDAGQYHCVITDSAMGLLTSVDATLTVNAATVTVYAVPLASDPYPLVSDPYTYTYNQNVVSSANIGWNLLPSDNDTNYWIFKEPIGCTVKVKYNNGTNLPNAGDIPDAVFRAPVELGGFRYYLTRNPYAYDQTQPTNLTTS